jgi:SAM-dependent methyltransferase
MPFFYEIFHYSLPRQGPGDDASTLRALNELRAAPGQRIFTADHGPLKILDIGCGSGMQTLQLARHVDGAITALDNHQPFLDELQRRARAAGLSHKIRTVRGDMNNLAFEAGSFDLIWCEGAIFVAGFRRGLESFRHLLTPGGMMALTEMAWFRPDPPQECRDFIGGAYPPIMDVPGNLAVIEECGYDIIGHFLLPASSWRDDFYVPLEQRVDLLRRRQHADDPDRMALLDYTQQEIEINRKYSEYYGYVFFMLQRREGVKE